MLYLHCVNTLSIYNIDYILKMTKEENFLSLKDFGFSMKTNAQQRSEEFQEYINQMNEFDTMCYWITSTSGIGAKMTLEGSEEIVSAFISNDYLGMSQRPETIEAGIEAVRKYGTGACAAQAIGGYLDIHKKLKKK